MKVLLDEQLPRPLKKALGKSHFFLTVSDTGWNGVKNGALLKLMAAHEFEVFITNDKGLRHQQNLSLYPMLMVLVLDALSNDLDDILPFAGPILQRLDEGHSPGVFLIALP